MRKIIPPLLGFAICAAILIPALACLWDYDTLAMENQRFPDALELITGKFLRHSPEFYQWRIADRIKKLEKEPQKLDHYDDLAVAYEKVGDHQKAIETILKKDKIKPDQYETLANLGTFYIFDNQLEKSVPCIERAIAINPDAHFGREVYQKLLVQYALSRRKDEVVPLPLSEHQRGTIEFADHGGFWPFLCSCAEFKHVTGADMPDEHKRAVKGVLGMMKFASFDSPLLLEALGDLLLCRLPDYDAKQLAARAYLKASYEVKDDASRKAYRKMAEDAISLKMKDDKKLTMDQLETDFAAELKEAESWYANVRSDEIQWINAGLNPEEQFTAKYYTEPRTTVAPDKLFTQKTRESLLMVGLFAALAVGLSALIIGLVRRLRAN